MGSNFNFRNFGNNPPAGGDSGGGGVGRPPGNFPLTRQSSVYSLTFDEFQSSLGGLGKDFGSMNMDELLKNIWSAEENQNMGSGCGAGGGGGGGGGGDGQESGGNSHLQRQGSLTLPRTISQKTVDEVWRDMSKEYSGGKNENGGVSGFNFPQRQQTLGEITLEEFLLKAGVVREDTAQFAGKNTNIGVFDDGNNSGLGFLYQQANRNVGLDMRSAAQQIENQNQSIQQELLQNQSALAYRNQINMHSTNLPLNVNGVKASGQQQKRQQGLLPKQPVLPYGAINGGQLSSPVTRGGIVGNADPVMTNNFVPSGGLGVVGLGNGGGVSVATGSPAFSSDGLSKSNGDATSISPMPYVFSGGIRGRKGAALEKVVERRQRRMIKNRESAARSRARKQAYTMELEAEIAKLKEENQGLQNKQAEIMEMQKNQVLEMKQENGAKRRCLRQVLEMKQENGAKRRCLRRTQTGPW